MASAQSSGCWLGSLSSVAMDSNLDWTLDHCTPPNWYAWSNYSNHVAHKCTVQTPDSLDLLGTVLTACIDHLSTRNHASSGEEYYNYTLVGSAMR